MSGFAIAELQAAVFAALDADTALAAKVAGVWDEPDAGALYPYVTMGDGEVEDVSTKTEVLSSHQFQINIWSDAAGRMECKEIMELVHSALNNTSLALTGSRLVLLAFLGSSDERDDASGSVLYHGTMTFKALVEQI